MYRIQTFLPLPLFRKWLQHNRQRHLRRLSPVKYHLDNIRCQQAEAQDAGHVSKGEFFVFGQFGDGGELPAFEHFLPAEGTGQRLYQRAVDAGFFDGCGFAVWGDDLFAATVFSDGEPGRR